MLYYRIQGAWFAQGLSQPLISEVVRFWSMMLCQPDWSQTGYFQHKPRSECRLCRGSTRSQTLGRLGYQRGFNGIVWKGIEGCSILSSRPLQFWPKLAWNILRLAAERWVCIACCMSLLEKVLNVELPAPNRYDYGKAMQRCKVRGTWDTWQGRQGSTANVGTGLVAEWGNIVKIARTIGSHLDTFGVHEEPPLHRQVQRCRKWCLPMSPILPKHIHSPQIAKLLGFLLQV